MLLRTQTERCFLRSIEREHTMMLERVMDIYIKMAQHILRKETIMR